MPEHECGAYPRHETGCAHDNGCEQKTDRLWRGTTQGWWYMCPIHGLYLSIDWCECD